MNTPKDGQLNVSKCFKKLVISKAYEFSDCTTYYRLPKVNDHLL